MFDLVKSTRVRTGYIAIAFIYDTIRRRGKVPQARHQAAALFGNRVSVSGLRRRAARLQADVEILLAWRREICTDPSGGEHRNAQF